MVKKLSQVFFNDDNILSVVKYILIKCDKGESKSSFTMPMLLTSVISYWLKIHPVLDSHYWAR